MRPELPSRLLWQLEARSAGSGLAEEGYVCFLVRFLYHHVLWGEDEALCELGGIWSGDFGFGVLWMVAFGSVYWLIGCVSRAVWKDEWEE
jgi:hypothetical protein